MTIEMLAETSQPEFLDIKKTMATKGDVKLILSAIERLSGQIADVKQSRVSALDCAQLETRIETLEKKLGVTSQRPKTR
jgi:hypothetical protein